MGSVLTDTDLYVIATNASSRTEEQPTHRDFKYVGYHRYTTEDYLNSCKLHYRERHIQQAQMLLETSGEQAALLLRKWEGIRCPLMSNITEHPNQRCPVCFGTGWAGGYDQYISDKTDNRIRIRFNPSEEDLELIQMGLRKEHEVSLWTLPEPRLRDRDILVRFNPDGSEFCRYEILVATRNRGFFEDWVLQTFRINQLDPTDIIYDFMVS